MICPQCETEYREGFTRCADCDVDLIDVALEDEGEPNVAIVKVYESNNAALLPLVESLLQDAGIEYMTKSDNLQSLFGMGTLGMGSNNVIGPATIWVREDDEAEARKIIDQLDEPGTALTEPAEP